MSTFRAEDYDRRTEPVGEWELGVVSYKLGDRYVCEVDNVSPGAKLARAEGAAREEAETAALGKARYLIAKTRIVPEG